ncbi:hypothetical protein P7K49_040525, partial [Saguinus oedipus]
TAISVQPMRGKERKVIDDARDQPLDKRVRFSVRLLENASTYKDIVVRKKDGFTQILLSTRSTYNNTLNREVMNEVKSALEKAAVDD